MDISSQEFRAWTDDMPGRATPPIGGHLENIPPNTAQPIQNPPPVINQPAAFQVPQIPQQNIRGFDRLPGQIVQQNIVGFDRLPGQANQAPQIPVQGAKRPREFQNKEPSPKRQSIESAIGGNIVMQDEGSDGKPLISDVDLHGLIFFLIGARDQDKKRQPREYIQNVRTLFRPYFSKDTPSYKEIYLKNLPLIRFLNQFFERVNTRWYKNDLSPEKVKEFYQIMREVRDNIEGQISEGATSLSSPDENPALSDLENAISRLAPAKLNLPPSNPTSTPPPSTAGRAASAGRGATVPPQTVSRGGAVAATGRGTARGGGRGRGGGGAGGGRGNNNPADTGRDVPIVPSTRGYEKNSDAADPLEGLDDPCFELLKSALYQGMIFFSFLKKNGSFFRS